MFQLLFFHKTWDKNYFTAAAAKSLQSCPTLCYPTDGSPPGSPVPGILQARTLVGVAIFFSNAWKWKVKVKVLSRVRLITTPWTAAYQAPLSIGFSRQEYWSGVPLPSPETYLHLCRSISPLKFHLYPSFLFHLHSIIQIEAFFLSLELTGVWVFQPPSSMLSPKWSP